MTGEHDSTTVARQRLQILAAEIVTAVMRHPITAPVERQSRVVEILQRAGFDAFHEGVILAYHSVVAELARAIAKVEELDLKLAEEVSDRRLRADLREQEIAALRIETPCPTCGHRTLFIGSGGHLTCSWLKCVEPDVERAVNQAREQLSAFARDVVRAVAVTCEEHRIYVARDKGHRGLDEAINSGDGS